MHGITEDGLQQHLYHHVCALIFYNDLSYNVQVNELSEHPLEKGSDNHINILDYENVHVV